MNRPIEKLPTVRQLLDERDQLKRELQEEALAYLSLETQNQMLYEENQRLKAGVAALRAAVVSAKDAFEVACADGGVNFYDYARDMQIALDAARAAGE